MKKVAMLLALLFFSLFPQNALAQEHISGASAQVVDEKLVSMTINADKRADALHAYLTKYDSPLADSADTFVAYADQNDIDWRLVAAISGLESGFGKAIPQNSYNAWGWGIYGTNVHNFASWDDGIKTISKGLRENYINKLGTDDVYAIGRIYAASPTWAQRVEIFMYQIDAFYKEYSNTEPTTALSLTI